MSLPQTMARKGASIASRDCLGQTSDKIARRYVGEARKAPVVELMAKHNLAS
jgi:hypothetical protein